MPRASRCRLSTSARRCVASSRPSPRHPYRAGGRRRRAQYGTSRSPVTGPDATHTTAGTSIESLAALVIISRATWAGVRRDRRTDRRSIERALCVDRSEKRCRIARVLDRCLACAFCSTWALESGWHTGEREQVNAHSRKAGRLLIGVDVSGFNRTTPPPDDRPAGSSPPAGSSERYGTAQYNTIINQAPRCVRSSVQRCQRMAANSATRSASARHAS